MNNTPLANRKTIVIVGNRNSGKSSLFNLILGQEMSIVSDYAGTTTDPVGKNMELIGYGPVRLIDTAGIDDIGDLGKMRVDKTQIEVEQADLVIHVFDASKETRDDFLDIKARYKKLNKKAVYIFNKCDKLDDVDSYKNEIGSDKVCLFIYADKNKPIDQKDKICKFIVENISGSEEEIGLLEGLAKPGDTVILVVPIDSQAPKGRLILPQVQVLRESLDKGIISIVVKDTELERSLERFKDIDLIITDSKIFDKVAKIIDKSGKNINLTSFSIVFARQKGDIDIFLEGASYIDKLKDGDRVLIAESCTHTSSHEDIGSVLIPNLIRKKIGKNLIFEFSQGKLDETDLSRFSLMIQCGGCMMTKNNMTSRINLAKKFNVPISNYGIVLAYLNGLFDRAIY